MYINIPQICCNYRQKIMTHHSVMTSSLRIKILKFDKFGYFSCDIDYNSRTCVFMDVISLTINQCDPRRPQGASGGHFVSACRAAQASEVHLYYIYYILHIYPKIQKFESLDDYPSNDSKNFTIKNSSKLEII